MKLSHGNVPLDEQPYVDTGLVKIESKSSNGKHVISEADITRLQPLLEKYWDLWLLYPDKYVEFLTPPESNFRLEFIQKAVLRAALRYEQTFLTATRGFSKSFLGVGAKIIKCSLIPNCHEFICAETMKQANAIAQQKVAEWLRYLPAIDKQINRDKGTKTTERKDSITIEFDNKSTLVILSTDEGNRGLRKTGGLAEEAIKLDQTGLNEVVIPMANVPRRMADGTINPHEPKGQFTFVTSAGYKNTFAYEKAVETLIKSAIDPSKAISIGMDYKVPLKLGFLDKQILKNVKINPTYTSDSFAREYCSRWTGSSEQALFSFDKMNRYRTIKKCEQKPHFNINSNAVYYLSVDVARARDRTAFVIFKVLKRTDSDWEKRIVQIKVYEKMSLQLQSKKIREIDRIFNFEKIIVDANGIGQSIIDSLVEDINDPESGEYYPGYNVINTNSHPQYKNSYMPHKLSKLYALMTNQNSAGQIHLNCFSQIQKGNVKFLIDEGLAKQTFMRQKTFLKKSLAERLEILMPYKNTSLLINETTNLKQDDKQNTQHLKLVYIQGGSHKDLFSAMEYGLWIINEDEKYYFSKIRKSSNKITKFMFVN